MDRHDLLTISSPHAAFIHIIDDDSLLNIFCFYRPVFIDEDEELGVLFRAGRGWGHERWWFKVAHVCQRWRRLILGSASYLGLCLVCTTGTPVADMLAHAPPLPLIVDHSYERREITAEDRNGITLALKQYDRVRRIRLRMHVVDLRKLIVALSEEYPILEYLIMGPLTEERPILRLRNTFQAPHLRHLLLIGFQVIPTIGLSFLMTTVDLVVLSLVVSHPSTYFQPTILRQWLSLMPQLESLLIEIPLVIPNRDAEIQLTRTAAVPPITLPNLRRFVFLGAGTYLETVVRGITAPQLKELGINLFKELTVSVPHILQFVNTAESLQFSHAEFKFLEEIVTVELYLHEDADIYPLTIAVDCWSLDLQVSSVAHIFNSLGQGLPAVEHLALERVVASWSSDEDDDSDADDPTEWHNLLRSFSNVKTLRVEDGLVEEISSSLRSEDGELPRGLLPKLQELTYRAESDTSDTSAPFTSFIDARRNAGRPVSLVRHTTSPNSSEPSSDVLVITSELRGGYVGDDF